MNPLVRLPRSNLDSLRSAFLNGALKYGLSKDALIRTGLSPERAEEAFQYFTEYDLTRETILAIIDTVIEAQAESISLTQSLVVTGPDVSSCVNLATESRFSRLVEHAKKELMMATFALYQGDEILKPIHRAMEERPELKVILVLNIARKYGDTTISSELVETYKREFYSKHWVWDKKPEVYYYPQALDANSRNRSSMHAKFLIADEERCFITSANFTRAAQKRNIEVGVELSHSEEPKTLSRYFKGLIREGVIKSLD